MSNRGPVKTTKKQINQFIGRFHYYAEAILREQRPKQDCNGKSQKVRHISCAVGPNQYHYIHQSVQSFCSQQPLQPCLLMSIAKQTLLDTDVAKINNTTFFKSYPKAVLTLPQTATEVVQFAIIDQKQTISKTQNEQDKFMLNLQPQHRQYKPSKYSLYIIHQTNNPSPWNYLIQRLLFTETQSNTQKNITCSLKYQALISITKQKQNFSLIKWFSRSQKDHFMTRFVQQQQQKIALFQSVLVKSLHDVRLRNIDQQKHSHPEFKRETRLPPGEFKKYQLLKKQTYGYFCKINKNRKANSYFLDNLVCRFMKFKNYNQQQTIIEIKRYLDWQKYMRITYTYESFNQYHSKDIFTYIGKDLQGRPILFYRPDHVIVSQVLDLQHFVDYNFYMMDIYMQDQMEGYIDEFILLSDYQHFGSDNFKFHIAKSVADSSSLFPDRQHKLICFNIGGFCHFVYKLVRPLIPAYAVDKLHIFGMQKQPFKAFAASFMDLKLLPKYILADSTIEASSQSQITAKNTLSKPGSQRKVWKS